MREILDYLLAFLAWCCVRRRVSREEAGVGLLLFVVLMAGVGLLWFLVELVWGWF
jgi:hypothetical protein